MAFRYDRLKALRKEKGYKQISLANDLHISRSTLAMWEIGQSEPTLDTCIRISELLDCSVGYLLGTEEEVNAIKAADPMRRKYMPNIESIEFALFDTMGELSEAAKQDVLEFALFRQAQEAKEKSKHDD